MCIAYAKQHSDRCVMTQTSHHSIPLSLARSLCGTSCDLAAEGSDTVGQAGGNELLCYCPFYLLSQGKMSVE